MTISDLAEYLQVSKSSLYKLVQAGKVPGQKVGRHWRFHRGAIDSWLKGRRRNPRKTPKTLEQREAQSGLDHAEDART